MANTPSYLKFSGSFSNDSLVFLQGFSPEPTTNPNDCVTSFFFTGFAELDYTNRGT